MNPSDVVVTGKGEFRYWKKSDFFENFLSVSYKVTGKKNRKINFRFF